MRAFMEEAGIAFEDIRYSFDEWNGKTEAERAEHSKPYWPNVSVFSLT